MKKRNFSAEFKRESAQLVVDQTYTVADAAKAMDVGLSTMTRWVKQLRDERQGKTPKASPITPEQIEIRKLSGFAPIFPDTCYHLTHYWPAAADI
uniref:transposase n=1 Tax=Escherichia coli TaxID=562 RepID=UPI001F435B5A